MVYAESNESVSFVDSVCSVAYSADEVESAVAADLRQSGTKGHHSGEYVVCK